MDSDKLVEALLRPDAYPEPTTTVELIQTHISWVFLTDTRVIKVKKPVDFGFLNFTTPAKRQHFCQREVLLNSRLAPWAYLGVAELRLDGDRLTVDGPGETVDYAVRMVRLPADRMLRNVLGRGEATEQTFAGIAQTLAAFHASAETSPEIQAMKGLDGVRFNCDENFLQTERYVGTLLSDETFNFIRTSTNLFLRRKAVAFERRAAQGRVVDGHGDLHLDAICVTDPVTIFDCIEFNERFRVLDVAEEVAFLAMDLEFGGWDGFAASFISAYVAASGDGGLRELLSFYKAYRAYVRAKINSFSVDDAGMSAARHNEAAATARRYYELAARYAREFNPQRLIVTCGLTGSGKSTLARGLAEHANLQVVSSDRMRKGLLGLEAADRHHDAFNHGIYAPSITDRTYQTMMLRAEALLQVGQSVILDGCFTTAAQRAQAVDLARRVKIPMLLLDCHTPEDLIRARLNGRIKKNSSVSDGRWEIYQNQLKVFEPPDEIADDEKVVLDRSRPVAELLAELEASLPPEWFDQCNGGA